MKPRPFDYVRPDTIDETVALLAEHGDEARILAGVERFAEAFGDSGQRFRMAPHGAAQHAVEYCAALGEIFPQPARLAPAQFREPVVVVRPEGRLRMPHQHQFRHSPKLYGTIAA